MSEFSISVVRVGKIGKPKSADTLGVTQVKGYPVIVKLGDFQEGDLAIHVCPDAIVDISRPEFSWLKSPRVKFTKIRGVPSYGFLIPAPEGAVEGQDFQEALGITKYDPGPDFSLQGKKASYGPSESRAPYYDIQGFRKYRGVIPDGTVVSVTEKIHGSNARFTLIDGELFCGSRTQFRENSIWNEMGEKYKVKEFLENCPPGCVLYGEIFGPKVQDLAYGRGVREMVFFDLYHSLGGVWYDADAFLFMCKQAGLPTPPELYRGPYDHELMLRLAEGDTVLGHGVHCREGVVIKPLYELRNAKIGRVFLKLVGETYLTRKGG